MEIKEMSNNALIRYRECCKEELKMKQSELKQLDEEITRRYKEGGYSDEPIRKAE